MPERIELHKDRAGLAADPVDDVAVEDLAGTEQQTAALRVEHAVSVDAAGPATAPYPSEAAVARRMNVEGEIGLFPAICQYDPANEERQPFRHREPFEDVGVGCSQG